MDLDGLFSSLDSLEEKTVAKLTCCSDISNYLSDNGIIVCSKCGNTISNIMDGPEWRFYGVSDSKRTNPTRCGMPVNVLLPESSIGTCVSYRGGDKNMYKVRQYQKWSGMPYKERSLLKVFEEITRLSKKGNIPNSIITEAHMLYKITSSTKISRGSNRKGIIAACLYFACKINKVPRSTSEIAEIFDINTKIMSKGCKKFQEIMQLNKVDIYRINDVDSINLYDFIDRFCSNLDLSEQDITNIKTIAEKSVEINLVYENTPPSMAAGCIFLYVKHKQLSILKKDISDVCKISEVTINKCFKKLEPHTEYLVELI
jgi:transcription initiation factor TFIIB